MLEEAKNIFDGNSMVTPFSEKSIVTFYNSQFIDGYTYQFLHCLIDKILSVLTVKNIKIPFPPHPLMNHFIL